MQLRHPFSSLSASGLNLGLDYLFLAVYACAIALGCVLVARIGAVIIVVLSGIKRSKV